MSEHFSSVLKYYFYVVLQLLQISIYKISSFLKELFLDLPIVFIIALNTIPHVDY